jgi:transcriptional regulator with XRE-family HTH domain
MSLAEELKKAREGMVIDVTKSPSVAEMADEMGVSTQYLYQLESGSLKTASLKFLKKYAEKTGVSIQRFTDQIEV